VRSSNAACIYVIGLQVLTAVVMKSFVFLDIMPYRPLKAAYVSEEYVASIFRVGK
jgi:hypothetical protein